MPFARITAISLAAAIVASAATAQEACSYDASTGMIHAGADAEGARISPVAESDTLASFFTRDESGMTIVVHDCSSGASLTIAPGTSGRSGLIWEFEALMEDVGSMSLQDIAEGIGADVETTISESDIGNCDCLALGMAG
ncbi:hypothetical protein ACXN5S_08975 [Pseudoroseicyclus sp. H15]